MQDNPSKAGSQKARERQLAEERKAKALRDNLRRRKAAVKNRGK